MKDTSPKSLKLRRTVIVAIFLFVIFTLGVNPSFLRETPVQDSATPTDVLADYDGNSELAIDVLDRLEVKGRAPKTGYSRSEYGSGWGTVGGCDMRNIMLARGMVETVIAEDDCIVLSGTLNDQYTGKIIQFIRGSTTSDDVQIDHVVALSDSWQKGAQVLGKEVRFQFANDPLNLFAVDGPANQEKGDSDAASWLPPNKSFRCQYVARQIAVKDRYSLWVTEAEKSAMIRVLNGCGEQVIPISS